jgi:Fe-S-cluster-containing dehydrogenase component
MAEHENLLPEGGDVVAQIQSGGLSRRSFVMIASVAGATVMGSSLFSGVQSLSAYTKAPILVDANGVLLHDPSRCVACRRCELACSEFNDGAASSFLSRVKVDRSLAAATGINEAYTVIAGTCKQCPHPVPCAEACPKGAIIADGKTGARSVDPSLCIGCGVCTKACPWAMITVNPSTKKASKCTLCDGNPECVRACPTGALKFVAWRDLTTTPAAIASKVQPGIMADPSTTSYCAPCHS